jgi:hypothetical protein
MQLPMVRRLAWLPRADYLRTATTTTTTTLRADQEPCQNGLVEDHSGGYRIEPLRPSGVLVGYRPGEVRPFEVRPGKVRRA